MRQRQQRGQQRDGVGLGEAIVREGLLEFGELGLRSLMGSELQEPLEVVDNRIERTVLVIRRTAKLDTGGPFGADVLFKCLHQAGFANASLPAEQYYMSGALFRLCPPLPQEPEFFL